MKGETYWSRTSPAACACAESSAVWYGWGVSCDFNASSNSQVQIRPQIQTRLFSSHVFSFASQLSAVLTILSTGSNLSWYFPKKVAILDSGNDLNFSLLFACFQIEGKTGGMDKSSIVCVDCVLVSIPIPGTHCLENSVYQVLFSPLHMGT